MQPRERKIDRSHEALRVETTRALSAAALERTQTLIREGACRHPACQPHAELATFQGRAHDCRAATRYWLFCLASADWAPEHPNRRGNTRLNGQCRLWPGVTRCLMGCRALPSVQTVTAPPPGPHTRVMTRMSALITSSVHIYCRMRKDMRGRGHREAQGLFST